ncbi:hypothetical protein OnM2_005019, partial [Erysiphe neolycopersici]
PHQRQKRSPLYRIFVWRGYRCGKEYYPNRTINRIKKGVCERKNTGFYKKQLKYQLTSDSTVTKFFGDNAVSKISIRQHSRGFGRFFAEKGNNFDDYIAIHQNPTVLNECFVVGLVRQYKTSDPGLFTNQECYKF